MDLNGKRAVVTGGARGIGYQIARRLLGRGSAVSLWDLDGDALQKSSEILENLGTVHTVVCDVSDEPSVRESVRKSIAALGEVDILINNAGYMAPGYFLEQEAERWRYTMDVNLKGMLHTIHALLPHLQERGSGHIVNISSAAGLVGVPGLAVYSASKWGVFGLTEALREEAFAAGYPGIQYSSVHPMFLATGMFEGARLGGLGALLFPRVKDHDVIAEAVVEGALRRGRRCIKRPRSLKLVLLLRGLLPDALFGRIGRVMKLHSSMDHWKGPSKKEESA